MNKVISLNKRSVLISFVVLLLVAIVLFNFEKFTGQTINYGSSPVEVFPESVLAGNYIEIRVSADEDNCLRRDLSIHNADSKVRVAYIADMLRHLEPGSGVPFGRYKICEPLVVRFKTYSEWEGERYFVQAQEWCRNTNCQGKLYRSYFNVR